MNKFKYEIIRKGQTPTFEDNQTNTFCNPISIGDRIKKPGVGTELETVVSIEHYRTCSVLYI